MLRGGSLKIARLRQRWSTRLPLPLAPQLSSQSSVGFASAPPALVKSNQRAISTSTRLFALRPLPLFDLGPQVSESWPPSLLLIVATSLCSSMPRATSSRSQIRMNSCTLLANPLAKQWSICCSALPMAIQSPATPNSLVKRMSGKLATSYVERCAS